MSNDHTTENEQAQCHVRVMHTLTVDLDATAEFVASLQEDGVQEFLIAGAYLTAAHRMFQRAAAKGFDGMSEVVEALQRDDLLAFIIRETEDSEDE